MFLWLTVQATYVGGLEPSRLARIGQAYYFGEQAMHVDGVSNEVRRLVARLVAGPVCSHLTWRLDSSGGPCDLLGPLRPKVVWERGDGAGMVGEDHRVGSRCRRSGTGISVYF